MGLTEKLISVIGSQSSETSRLVTTSSNMAVKLAPQQMRRNDARCPVVFVESAAAMAGVQFSTLYLVQHLNSTKWKPLVICPEEGDLPQACRSSGIAVHILNYPKFRSTSFQLGRNKARLPNPMAWAWDGCTMLIAAQKLARFLREVKADLMVTKGLFAHFYGGLAANYVGVPCVWHVQDFISERFWKFYQRFFGQVARWLPDQIIVDSASIGCQLHRTVQDKISVIHNGVDTKVFRPNRDGHSIRRELGIPIDAMVIGHVGRMTPWKGQHYLLEAFARIAGVMENVYLLFVGAPVFDSDTYQRSLLSQSVQLGLSDRVKFAGYRHDIPMVLASMDVFAFTSVEKDTSPLILLSAMSAGLPTVAFDIEGVKELLPASEQLLVPVGQVNALAWALTKLLSNADLRRRLAMSARQLAEAEFGVDKYVSSVQRVFLKATRNSV